MITLERERAGVALGVGALAQPVTGVSIDSRTLRTGDLFIALRGERFDGHDYVEAALAAGASGAVVDKRVWRSRAAGRGAFGGGALGGVAVDGMARRGPASTRPIYEVDDTLEALGALAREVRRVSGATVFAITGSVGKTSTKDILRAMLGKSCRVAGTAGNQNNEVGLPLTLLGIEPDTQAVVTEMGMRGLGQIAALAAVAEPDVGVITNVHPVHLELLGTLEAIAEAKAELLAGVKAGGAAVVPADCAPLERCLECCPARVVRFGMAEDKCEADVVGWMEGDEWSGERRFTLRWPEGEAYVSTGRVPRHTQENAVAAAAACYAAGLPVAECLPGIAEVELSQGRGQVKEIAGLYIIDDTYNSNPAAARAALDDLTQVAVGRKGRAVAILGDMLELGADWERFHADVGRYAAETGVRVLWGVGPLAAAITEGFRGWWQSVGAEGPGWSAGHVDSSDTWRPILSSLRPGDVVLFKASRSVRLENVVRRVVEEAAKGGTGGSPASEDGVRDRTRETR